MDFTLKRYIQILVTFIENSYKSSASLLLRHDVDRIPQNALKMAKLEASIGVKSIYFFRIVPHVFKADIIQKIAAMGHEIGYHYEDIDLAAKSLKGSEKEVSEKELTDIAINLFEMNLERMRKYYPITKICMHGSPLSKYDNRLLWKYYNYRDYGIEFEPYFDVDYNEVFYITDTGRKWNNENVSVRDKVNSGFDIKIRSTKHLIRLIEKGKLPDKIMINVHPHRWFNFGKGWVKELVMQNIKNVVKYYLIKSRKEN